MRKLIYLFILIFSVFAFAEAGDPTVIPPDPTAAPTAEELKTFFAAIGGWASLGTMGFVMIAVQAVLFFLRSKFANFIFEDMAGWVKFLVVSFLSLVSCVLALKLGPANLSWAEALLHSSTLTSFQVYLHQGMKQLGQKLKS